MKNKVGFRISVLGSVALVVSSTTVVAHADESELADLETRSVQAMEQLESFVEVNSDSVEIEQVDGNIVVSDNEVMSYSVPTNPENSINFNGLEIAVLPEEIDTQDMSGTFIDGSMIYPAADESISTVITPLDSQALETYYLLEDSTAPETLTSPVIVPEGMELRSLSQSSAAIYDQDEAITTYISAPWAVDSNGNEVELTLSVEGDNLVLNVEHQNRDDLVYPILVDPYYETMWSNVAEAVWCSTNWIAAACLRAKNNATKALTQAESWYPKSLHNGIGDGFRHCYWNALMTVDDGPTTASKIATRHEDAAKNQPANEKTMDLRNNQIGRNIAGSKGSKTYASVRNSCKSRADAKTLWYLVSGKLKYGK